MPQPHFHGSVDTLPMPVSRLCFSAVGYSHEPGQGIKVMMTLLPAAGWSQKLAWPYFTPDMKSG
jgi:hypothetical protein